MMWPVKNARPAKIEITGLITLTSQKLISN